MHWMSGNFPFTISEINISQNTVWGNNHNWRGKNNGLEKEIYNILLKTVDEKS